MKTYNSKYSIYINFIVNNNDHNLVINAASRSSRVTFSEVEEQILIPGNTEKATPTSALHAARGLDISQLGFISPAEVNRCGRFVDTNWRQQNVSGNYSSERHNNFDRDNGHQHNNDRRQPNNDRRFHGGRGHGRSRDCGRG